MLFQKHIPGFPVSRYVDSILYLEGNNKGAGFPKTAMSLAFNLNDSFKLYTDDGFTQFEDYKKYWVAGFQTQPRYVESYGESKMLVIQFKTLGAHVFLDQPLKHFTDHYIALDCVFKNEAEETWEQLKEAETIEEKFLVAERFLHRKLLAGKIPHEKLISSMDLLIRNGENLSVKEICQKHRISRKHLNFLFKEYLGVSPKMLSSLYRFQEVLRMISQSRHDKLTDLAHELDFFDQSHFNNHFKRFTGIRPNDYIKNMEVKPTLKIIPHFLPAD
jgi:AraC-like DNA-binding protein